MQRIDEIVPAATVQTRRALRKTGRRIAIKIIKQHQEACADAGEPGSGPVQPFNDSKAVRAVGNCREIGTARNDQAPLLQRATGGPDVSRQIAEIARLDDAITGLGNFVEIALPRNLTGMFSVPDAPRV